MAMSKNVKYSISSIACIILLAIFGMIIYLTVMASPTETPTTSPTTTAPTTTAPTTTTPTTAAPTNAPTVVAPTAAPTVTAATTAAPIVTSGSQWCTNGTYCDGTPVPQNEAQVGVTVCGGNMDQYKCNLVNGQAQWNSTGQKCTTGMPHSC